MRHSLIILMLFGLSGCSYNMTIGSNFVASNQDQFRSTIPNQQKICLVNSPEMEGYILEKQAYNWAGGDLFKDTLYFDIGRSVSSELNQLVATMFRQTCQTSSLKNAIGENAFIIQPKIVSSRLDLPTVRGEDIKAEITVDYSFYNPDGQPITTQTITGIGSKALVLTKENYNIALREAIKDLINQSKKIIEKVAAQST